MHGLWDGLLGLAPLSILHPPLPCQHTALLIIINMQIFGKYIHYCFFFLFFTEYKYLLSIAVQYMQQPHHGIIYMQ